MYNKQNDCNIKVKKKKVEIWLESMKLAVLIKSEARHNPQQNKDRAEES